MQRISRPSTYDIWYTSSTGMFLFEGLGMQVWSETTMKEDMMHELTRKLIDNSSMTLGRLEDKVICEYLEEKANKLSDSPAVARAGQGGKQSIREILGLPPEKENIQVIAMNRKIKFRAYDTVKKEWLGGSKKGFNLLGESTLIGGILAQPYYTHNVFEKLNDVHVMEFIGIEDKNKQEIYEGDIIHALQPDAGWACGEVFYSKINLAWHMRWADHEIAIKYIESYQVVGNIHDSPELLL